MAAEQRALGEVTHIRQTGNWDCGLVCVEMVLRGMGQRGFSFGDLHAKAGTSSTWTIDLAYVLHHFAVPFSYYTTVMGMNEDYAKVGFYANEWNADNVRVPRLFEEAPACGIRIEQKSLSSETVLEHLRSGGWAIVLVDAREIVTLGTSEECSCLTALVRSLVRGGYLGHYILLTGYDGSTDSVTFFDPARSSGPSFMSSGVLHSARTAYGTDEDILMIELPA